jgi:hypothetical protein
LDNIFLLPLKKGGWEGFLYQKIGLDGRSARQSSSQQMLKAEKSPLIPLFQRGNLTLENDILYNTLLYQLENDVLYNTLLYQLENDVLYNTLLNQIIKFLK